MIGAGIVGAAGLSTAGFLTDRERTAVQTATVAGVAGVLLAKRPALGAVLALLLIYLTNPGAFMEMFRNFMEFGRNPGPGDGNPVPTPDAGGAGSSLELRAVQLCGAAGVIGGVFDPGDTTTGPFAVCGDGTSYDLATGALIPD